MKSRHTSKGITDPWRLTLTDGTVTRRLFQAVDEHKPTMQLASGTELNFVDSYKYNLAAYQLAELLGIDDLLRVCRTQMGRQSGLAQLVVAGQDG